MAQPERIPRLRAAGPRQLWANLLVLLLGVAGISLSLFLRGQVLGASVRYSNLQAGINVAYPPGWLLEEGGSDHVFRIRDLRAPGFATTLQVALQPVSEESAARNIFDALTLQRAQTLAAYTVTSEEPYTLPDGRTASAMRYSYASTGDNPFLRSVPVIVNGLDVLIIERNQALVITYRAAADSYERELPRLRSFLASLEF